MTHISGHLFLTSIERERASERRRDLLVSIFQIIHKIISKWNHFIHREDTSKRTFFKKGSWRKRERERGQNRDNANYHYTTVNIMTYSGIVLSFQCKNRFFADFKWFSNVQYHHHQFAKVKITKRTKSIPFLMVRNHTVRMFYHKVFEKRLKRELLNN